MQPNAAHELRFAVESLPRPAREALLEAVDRRDLLTGVYARGGQVCPSVAVHRLGPGERMAGFARAWDAYTGADPDASRQATAAEREGLRAMIERSLAREEPESGPLRSALAAMDTASARRAAGPEENGAAPEEPADGSNGDAARDPLEELARTIEIHERDTGRVPRDPERAPDPAPEDHPREEEPVAPSRSELAEPARRS